MLGGETSEDPLVPFYASCVEWPEDLLDALTFIVEEGDTISRATFIRNTGISREQFGSWYPEEGDYHIGYRSLARKGIPIYYFVHSATEFVFGQPDDIQIAQEKQLAQSSLDLERAI